MICESMGTAVTEHICSKMRQLFNVSTSMKLRLSSKIIVIILRSGTGTADFTGASSC